MSQTVAEARIADVRERDRARLERQMQDGLFAGGDAFARPRVEPEPLTQPERRARPLNPEAQDILSHETEFSGEPDARLRPGRMQRRDARDPPRGLPLAPD